ncbi:uncharacterized protein LOC112342384 [Selaginella moellendorffii]|uniref:uncharacterized protein LOC112342384 n=1 Tax=Selaginella moellendorffii TaxID=88036 RepID=UPI000D1C8981|nr:uncharacterized protein LOC112342384 [Selaginella moellendorffii]|eukprot:XP_024519892.1 uncharacterized protein LOC112342384 [Selaginella moellendorffii]
MKQRSANLGRRSKLTNPRICFICKKGNLSGVFIRVYAAMAMAPSLRIGGRIASSFLGINSCNGARKCVSSNGSSRSGHLLVVFRGQFSASAPRRAKGSAATEWHDSADAYFGAKDSIGSVDSSLAEGEDFATHSKRSARIAARLSKNSEEATEEHDRRNSPAKFEDRGLSVPARKKDSFSIQEEESNVASSDPDDEFEEAEDERERKRFLPTGMRRLKRGYGRNDMRGNDMRRYYDPREIDEKPSEVPALRGEALYGIGPVRAALQARRRDLYVLYIQNGLDEKHPGKRKALADVLWIMKAAKRLELRVETTSKHALNVLVDNRPHQGMVLDASPLEMVDISALDRPDAMLARAPVWVALDEVKDPQNFGAILRSSHFFGVCGVVVCSKNSAPLSGVVSKASAGALEMIDLLSCKNMMMFLRDSADNGWRVIGTSNSPESEVLGDLPKNVPTILVLGNEGVGIRPFVKAACTHMIRIPGALPFRRPRKASRIEEEAAAQVEASSGSELALKAAVRYEMMKLNSEADCVLRPGTVDSLNVSVAAGVLLHELTNFSTKSPSPLKLPA